MNNNYKFKSLDELIKTANSELFTNIHNLLPEFVKVAQEEYDAWDENAEYFQDEYAGGGICHIIAQRICDILYDHHIDAFTFSLSHKQHVIALAYDNDTKELYAIDLPEYLYETGGGFTWQKIKDVTIEPSYFNISNWSSEYDQFFDENNEYIEG